ncbi:Secondary metabolism regulator LAE1 like protein [Verticillium longisporum]|uniref:Secondary metabolism regulator LAE1 like protein n=1 Tax=Verticillium longisporum TaxID=100787 RepID=A0A8I2ZSU6_VERLO|nr:Secondary metabolism regulator LAE1 like protein [Verticillium longisporum]
MSSQQQSQQPSIAADPDVVGNLENDNDSSADVESLRESTASLRSSILEYRNINGRHFQSSTTTDYWAPTDEKHIEGFDLAHQYMLLLMDNKLYNAPIGNNPQRILDIGTGTGIWAIDMADEFPSAEVLGTDISAVQPSWLPPNCKFEIDDAQLDWTFPVNHFSYIHARHLYGGIDDWPKLYRQAFTHCAPGGWFENVEIELTTRAENPRYTLGPDHVFTQWRDLFFAAGDKIGRTFRIAENNRMERDMRDAGFVDIVTHQWKVPIGGWASDPKLKKVGLFNGLFIDQSIDGFVVFPIGEILGWSFDEVTVLVANMRAALRDPKALPYYNLHMVYGRKPDNAVSPPLAPQKSPSPSA